MRPSRSGTGSSATGCARIPQDRELYAAAKRRLARETVQHPGRYNLAKNDVIDEIYARIFAAGPDPDQG